MAFESFQLLQGETILATLRWYETDQPWFCCRFEPTAAFADVKPLFDEQAQNGYDEILDDKIDALGLRLKDTDTGQVITEFCSTLKATRRGFVTNSAIEYSIQLYTAFMPRVYLSSALLEPGLRGEEFDLDVDTAKKLTRVLRLTSGEIFVAFDGLGGQWECVLTHVNETGKSVRAAILNEVTEERAQRLHISVAQAVPKGEKMEFVLQKGTELGVREFWPLLAARSVPTFDDELRVDARSERWRKIVQNACAQCGRADLPIVHAPCEFATAVDYGTSNSRCFMLDERGGSETLRQALQREPLLESGESSTRNGEREEETPRRVMLLVGPEGGWTEREREWADRYGVESVGLGRSILRTETAALVAVSVLSWEAGELG